MKHKNEQQKYRANPYEEPNFPIAYSKHTNSSQYLLSLFLKFIDNKNSVLELRSNVNVLLNTGHTKISRLNINKNALKVYVTIVLRKKRFNFFNFKIY